MRVDYMQKGAVMIAQSEEQLALERDVLEMQIEFLVQSLYGKVGSASLTYAVKEYSRK